VACGIRGNGCTLQRRRTVVAVPTVGSIPTALQIVDACWRKIAGLSTRVADSKDPKGPEVAGAMIDKVLIWRVRPRVTQPG
jgi:hypothetical protein